ncbi:hypothetical protein HZA97_02155 [Candidatus Woesearchaeota archaeon]|nr:hypothetical protein [Candidatus Woesearchaeota archaeon]
MAKLGNTESELTKKEANTSGHSLERRLLSLSISGAGLGWSAHCSFDYAYQGRYGEALFFGGITLVMGFFTYDRYKEIVKRYKK